MNATVRLTEHARARCRQMGVSTKTVKCGMREPEFTHRSRNASGMGREVSISKCGDLVVVHDGDVVLTVVWAGTFDRSEVPQ